MTTESFFQCSLAGYTYNNLLDENNFAWQTCRMPYMAFNRTQTNGQYSLYYTTIVT